ncbi:hypothetical protein GH714_020937 [Hevea brasiliensis]|uniref:Atg6 BARA domain-containing protein n=1 Tax=Hevea brasiliensis TaxID=3981 RepID=A0A6A6NID3_HEVBR|nr:hypothetical protein GH714_020937 [Hevea brasiliensis]
MADNGRTLPVDPNLPRWVCQNCRHSLCITGVDSYINDSSSRSATQGFSLHGANSVLGSTRMDNSFVVLPKQRPQVQGGPSRTRNGAAQPHTGQSGKAMEESFVVVYKSEPAPDGGGTHLPSLGGPNGQLQPNNTGFQSTITVLKRAFEIAKTRHRYKNYQKYFYLFSQRDAILAKTEVSQAHLELLKQTNVLNDAFPIHHDGEFGTINNFRLGRLPKILVEWDEINAAWGQACLLLHTMCQYFKQKFHYPLSMSHLHVFFPTLVEVPLFLHMSICMRKGLAFWFLKQRGFCSSESRFDPVNLFWSTHYDKTMTLFLICLKDFAEFAYLNDQENNILPEK